MRKLILAAAVMALAGGLAACGTPLAGHGPEPAKTIAPAK